MLLSIAVVVLAAAPVKVAAPGFTFVGIDPRLGQVYFDRFLNLVSSDESLRVTTQQDIAQVLGLERQKALMGCGETSASCLTELAGALGVDALLSGSLAKSSSSYTVNVRAVKASDGSQLAASTQRVASEAELQDWLDSEAPKLASRLKSAFGIATPGPAPGVSGTAPSKASSLVRWVPAMVGGAALVAGAVTFGLSKGDAAALRGGELTDPTQISATASAGQTKETVGLVLMATGGALVASSVVWALLRGPADTQVAFAPSGEGAAFVVRGVLP
ncbi:MAG: hypothetical protein IT380_28785 [Myxococcales bacterium]|nr:hypothetical protein [Myxococcales bacterium]